MTIDGYTKAVLTVIAAALTGIALNLLITPARWAPAILPQAAEAQARNCVSISREPAPEAWGKLAAVTRAYLVFETKDVIRLASISAYQAATPEAGKPTGCKLIEIKRSP
jgi:hypothetical protein